MPVLTVHPVQEGTKGSWPLKVQLLGAQIFSTEPCLRQERETLQFLGAGRVPFGFCSVHVTICSLYKHFLQLCIQAPLLGPGGSGGARLLPAGPSLSA